MAQRNFQPKHRSSSPGRSFNHRKDWIILYDTTWEKYRSKFLGINSRCYACGAPATVVDHLQSHMGDVVLFKKTDNHIPLCTKCHNTVTALFDRKYRPGNPITKKIQWLQSTRARHDLTFKIKVMPSYP